MELMADAITTHIYAIYLLLAIMLFNTYLAFTGGDNFIKTAKKFKIMTPLYHVINASVAYTGAIVAAYLHDLSPTVILMIATSIFVMVLEIKRYKKMRVIRSFEKELQEEFFVFARKVYIAEITAIVFTFVVSKLF